MIMIEMKMLLEMDALFMNGIKLVMIYNEKNNRLDDRQ